MIRIFGITNILIIFLFFIPFSSFSYPKLESGYLEVNLKQNKLSYTLNISGLPDDAKISFIFFTNIRSVQINNKKVNFTETRVKQEFLYHVKIPINTLSPFKLTIDLGSFVARRLYSKGYFIFSENFFTLPLLVNVDFNDAVITNSVTLDFDLSIAPNRDYQAIASNSVYTVTFTRKYTEPFNVGFFYSFKRNFDGKDVKIYVLKGNEHIGLSIASWIEFALDFLRKTEVVLNRNSFDIIYLEGLPFSEFTRSDIYLTDFKKHFLVSSEFQSLEYIENYLTLVHEILHLAIGDKDFSPEALDIVEGLIQYLAIESTKEVFGDTHVSELIYNNYLLQVRYMFLSRTENEMEMVKYRKYPLIFRYISSVVGNVNLFAFFRQICMSDKEEITISEINNWFKNIVGIPLDNFLPLFNRTPNLDNFTISGNIKDGYISIFSTSPMTVTLPIRFVYPNTVEVEEIDIPPQGKKLQISPEIKGVEINFSKVFPEFSFQDNFIGDRVPSIIEEILLKIEESINTRNIDLMYSHYLILRNTKADKKINNIIAKRNKFFGNYNVKISLEYLYTVNQDLVVMCMVSYGLSFTPLMVKLRKSLNSSYYISDIQFFF